MSNPLIVKFWLASLLLSAALPYSAAGADPPVKKGVWVVQPDEQTGRLIHTMELTLHPRNEPRPALKVRLVPDEFDLVDGNAAIYYLKAGGFFEQQARRDRLREMHQKAAEQAQQENKSSSDLPPYSWLSMAPAELPVEEVKRFLELTSFQVPMLAEASRRRRLDLDRQIRDVENPFAYLLPEVQSMRELARMQSLRCKVAIAEGDTGRAIEVLGQQYALARHLGQDEFLVTNLVGLACAGIAWEDALHLVQHPDAPNLYWAFASLPRPLVDIRQSMSNERQLFYLQFKTFLDVDETPRTVGYWQDFLDRLIPEFGGLEGEFGLPSASESPQTMRAKLVGFIAAAYPGAKRYLIEVCGLPHEQVVAYPTAQVVFLAMKRYYDEARDDLFKWSHLPYWQQQAATRGMSFDDLLQTKADRAGWIAVPAQLLLPAVLAANAAVARCEQALAFVQTVEGIRMYGAAHDGRLPESLGQLPVPAPLDPVSGKPLEYLYQDDHAVLTAQPLPGHWYRLVLRFASP